MDKLKRPSLIIFALLVLANVAYALPNFIGLTITICFFLLTPGFLALRSLRLPKLEGWYTLVLSLGLSILIIMLTGLILNSLTVFGLHRPLTTFNIFAILDITTLALLIGAGGNLPLLKKPNFTSLSREEKAVISASTLLPTLAIFGAIRLNNGASNILTLILFVLIPLMFIWLVARPSLKRIYPFTLFSIAISILFTVSLRGWFVTGSDVQREFYVFQLALTNQHWNIHLFQDPYNACLSITILPTMLAKITHISPPYVYKVLFQLIFGSCIISIYLLVKKIRNSIFALFSAFLFMLFPMFITDMTIVNRQEKAFVFFSSLMLINFTSVFTKNKKTILTILFILGLILSHYSSSYIALILFLVAKVVSVVYKRYASNGKSVLEDVQGILNLRIILIALLLTFLWNTQITNTSGAFTSVVSSTTSSLFDQSATQLLTFNPLGQDVESPQALLNNYSNEGQSQDSSGLVYAGVPELAPTKIGKHLSNDGLDVSTLNNIIKQFISFSMQLFLGIGIIIIFLKNRKASNKKDTYLLCFCVAGLLLLIIQTTVPGLTNHYGTSRLFQQLLVVFVVPITTGLLALFAIKEKYKYIAAAILLGFFFLDLSGFIPQILGSSQPTISLSNSGIDYEAYYVHHAEIDSGEWLLKTDTQKSLVEMDDYARLRFIGPIHTHKLYATTVTAINPKDYIYDDSANTATGTYQVEIGAGKVSYRLPQNIAAQKNLIYSNSGSTIYK